MHTSAGYKTMNWHTALASATILLGSCDGASERTAPEDAGTDAQLEPPAPAPVEIEDEEVETVAIDRSHLADVGDAPLDYADPALWLCRPGNDPNPCLEGLDATELRKDGTLHVEPHVPAEAPPFDCFYAYPTVDITGGGNTTDFLHIDMILDVLRTQAARFSRICRVYAPLYRQRSFDNMNRLTGDPELAHRDLERAFLHYLEHHSRSRNFVIVAHSQGAGIMAQVTSDHIDADATLRARLISAALIGISITAPQGRIVGGTFQNLPFCTQVAQTGCVIAFQSFARELPPRPTAIGIGYAPEGSVNACTNPSLLAGNPDRYRGAYLPVHASNALFVPNVPAGTPSGIETDTLLVRDLFRGECVQRDGLGYLEIAPDLSVDDQRQVPAFRYLLQEALGIGMHTGDFSVVMDDLIDAVEQAAEAMP
jgi:Protein of unknown function (DUF3089)